MINFDYVRANTIKSAIDITLKNKEAQFIAGGTNLVDLMKKGVTEPVKLVDINGLPFRGIELLNDRVKIGALTLNSDVAESDLIKTKLPLLAEAVNAGASPQIRNMATVGGNMMQRTRCPYFYDTTMPCNKRQPGSGCGALKGYNRMHAIFGTSDKCIAVHPSDMCVALVALNATVSIATANGEKKLPFIEFHRLPGNTPEKDNNLQKGELITAIEIPVSPLFTNVMYNKIRDRASYAFALVSVAAALDIKDNVVQDVRLALGGVAHKPWRLVNAEKFLKGKPVSVSNFRQAADLATRDAKGYGHNNFKLKMVPNTLMQTLKTITGLS